MAQRAIIGINGDLIPFSEDLDRIRTPGLGGSAVTWVPDADTLCDRLDVTANGPYSAAEAGKYGYDYVVVSVPGSSVTGRDPDTGQEVVVTKDPDTGEIVETVVPTEIRVTTPPTFIGPYGDGAYIDFTGLTVAAYDANGEKMQDVPFNELLFPTTVAVFDPNVEPVIIADIPDYSDRGSYTISALGAAEIVIGEGLKRVNWTIDYNGFKSALNAFIVENSGKAFFFTTRKTATPTGGSWGYFSLYAVDVSVGDKITLGMRDSAASFSLYGSATESAFKATRYNVGSTTQYLHTGISDNGNVIDVSGLGVTGIAGTPQSIPVQWQRPGDGLLLETEFDIYVVDVSPDSNGSGQGGTT